VKIGIPILLLAPCALFADCVNFPAGLVPFSAVNYVTAANSLGDHLVVGSLAGGPSGLNALIAQIPTPASTNQTFCDAQVQLAPQQFFASVYVPTQQELSGNFSAFAGLLVDPNGQAYPKGIIPAAQLGPVFAFRIGAAQAAQAVRGWSPTGSMPIGIETAQAVVLPNGKVFIPTSPALLYDPSTGEFAAGPPTLFPHGSYFTATLLDNGLVLVLGGTGSPSGAELYDPVSTSFTALQPMLQEHYSFTATKLINGQVLIASGSVDNTDTVKTVYAGAELFDPASTTFTSTGPILVKRQRHTATLLPDGKVLIAGGTVGGQNVFSAEIYDPTSGQFSPTGSLNTPRDRPTSVLLTSGKVLIAGGFDTGGESELFDPVKGTFSVTGAMASEHGNGRVVLLSNGQALIFGGRESTLTTSTALTESYNPASGAFNIVGAMAVPRLAPSAALLPDGRVLAAGGTSDVFNDPALSSAEVYTPFTQGLVTSQTGLTFRAAKANTTPVSQTVAVLSPSDSIPWTSSVKTYPGGSWLSVTPASGNSVPGAPPILLTITVNPANLAGQDYYGAVTLTPTDQKHPPVSVSVVFSVVPAGVAAPVGISPNGLLFTSVFGSSAPPQSFKISNVTSAAVRYTASFSTNPWFGFNPSSGTIGPAQSTSITVTPENAALNAGVNRGSITLTFTDGSAQTVDLLLVISPAPVAPAATMISPERPRDATGCSPKRLLPVITSLGTGFTAPVAWPVSLAVQVVDDCGNNVDSGSVVASFTSGDPALALHPIGGGIWTGTWVPARSVASSLVRADAQTPTPRLTGTVQVSGQTAINSKVPLVNAGGVLSWGDYAGSPALGLVVSIFGTALADGPLSANPPLPKQLGSTSVLMSGVELPVLSVSDSQVNVIVPYDIAVNTTHQLVVARNNAISVPAPTGVFDTQPAILAAAGNGLAGQGAVYKTDDQGSLTLADTGSPVSPGDVLVISCVGLGAVDPSIEAGAASPTSPPSMVTGQVTVTIGGQSAAAMSAGLIPNAVGLYQVSVVVPCGIAAADQVPITVSVNGTSSAGNIYIAAAGDPTDSDGNVYCPSVGLSGAPVRNR
jgi:uncharacterized protein (TIGR03437 family)